MAVGSARGDVRNRTPADAIRAYAASKSSTWRKKPARLAGGLLADDGGLIFSVSPREQQAGRGAGRPDHYPPLGSLVETAERPAGSVSGLPRHAGHRGINPITGTAAEPRSSVVAASSDDHSVLLVGRKHVGTISRRLLPGPAGLVRFGVWCRAGQR